jgi:cell wall-associated NlpC family hydrolase
LFNRLTPFAGRLIPARPDLAAAHLKGEVQADRFVEGRPFRVTATLLDMTAVPDPAAERTTQLLHGEGFNVYEVRPDGLAWGQSTLDGYVGYVSASGLGPAQGPGMRISALWSQIYARPSARARVETELPFLAEVRVAGTSGNFYRLRDGGFVPIPHLASEPGEFVALAERFIGAPYLWGGRSIRGIDCSGLVQIAMIGSGRPAPRDADMQAALIGAPVADDARLARGDLVFWRGHVGIMRDAETLLHANAHHMAVASEPLAEVTARIAAARGGPVIARRRS